MLVCYIAFDLVWEVNVGNGMRHGSFFGKDLCGEMFTVKNVCLQKTPLNSPGKLFSWIGFIFSG